MHLDIARCEYRMKPLIAAEATTFVLIQKVAKNQDNKDAYPLLAGSSRFFRCSNTTYFHITQKAKPSFPPLRWPAIVVRACAFFDP